MGRQLSRLLVSVSLVVTAWRPLPLRAAPPEDDATPAASEVDDLVERGIALRRAGDDARALALFLRAEQLQPRSARVRIHLAACHQALGRWEEADRYLTLSLEDPSDPYVVKHQSLLAEARRAIDAHLASLDVTGGPPGAGIWLNGRALGELPLARPLRIAAGIYTLEVRLEGYYSVVRTVALPGGELVREDITLAARTAPVAAPREAQPAPVVPREDGGLQWLPWTFAAAAAAATGGAAVALVVRERSVARYNDDSVCLPMDGRTRGETCGAERQAGDRAETWMWIGAASAGAFAVASATSFWLLAPDSAGPEQPAAAINCGVGFLLAQCSGRF